MTELSKKEEAEMIFLVKKGYLPGTKRIPMTMIYLELLRLERKNGKKRDVDKINNG